MVPWLVGGVGSLVIAEVVGGGGEIGKNRVDGYQRREVAQTVLWSLLGLGLIPWVEAGQRGLTTPSA